MGKPIEQALGEVEFCADIYSSTPTTREDLMADEPIELLGGEGSAVMRRSSLGVLLGIMPWNFPYYQVARFAGPNLVIGNTILLKHAPQCPESAAAMQQIFHDAGFPDGAYVNIYATNEQIEWVIADPRVRGVSLTGSERAGAAVAEIAGRNLKKVVLELGGSDPFILLGTDDLDAVVEAAVGGAAREHRPVVQRGQALHRGRRPLRAVPGEVHRRADRGRAAATRPRRTRRSARSPRRPRPTASRTRSSAPSTRARRSSPAAAATATSSSPTVLTDITPDNDAYREELFGPVAQVYRVGSEDEAVQLANDTPYGLGSYVMTTDPEQALRVADQIDAGHGVRQRRRRRRRRAARSAASSAPGFGRELGRYGADEFVNKKLIRIGG